MGLELVGPAAIEEAEATLGAREQGRGAAHKVLIVPSLWF
jgi:hypothetical protein